MKPVKSESLVEFVFLEDTFTNNLDECCLQKHFRNYKMR